MRLYAEERHRKRSDPLPEHPNKEQTTNKRFGSQYKIAEYFGKLETVIAGLEKKVTRGVFDSDTKRRILLKLSEARAALKVARSAQSSIDG